MVEVAAVVNSNKVFRDWQLVVCLFAVFGIGLSACRKVDSQISKPPYHPRDWAWTNEEWTGAETPYLTIAQEIEKAVALGENLDNLAAYYKKAAEKNPDDPQAQYAWGYAAVLARRPLEPFGDGNDPQKISGALAKPKSPQTYQYARMRYIVLLQWGTWLQLKDLGTRLLKKNSQDYLVKVNQVRLLALSSKEERQTALRYAQELVKKNPKRASALGALGDVYGEMCMRDNDIVAGDKAIQALRRRIELLPANHPGVEMAEYTIGLIKKHQAKIRQ
jgi:hypothetical protein